MAKTFKIISLLLSTSHSVCLSVSLSLSLSLSLLVLRTWLLVLLMASGDIHPNPVPMSSVSSISSSSLSTGLSASVFDSLSLFHHLSFVRILSKLDILHAELIDFDILAFPETWLSHSTSTEDLHLDTYCKPERKDRPIDKLI